MRKRLNAIVVGLAALGVTCSSMLLPSEVFAAWAADEPQSAPMSSTRLPELIEVESGGEIAQSGVDSEPGSHANTTSIEEASDPGTLMKLTVMAAPVRCTDAYTQGTSGTYVRLPAWMPYSGFSYNCYLDRGTQNTAVTELQYSLKNCNGQNIAVDGVFGAATEQAVKNVQYNRGLAVDGVYGPNTGSKMTWRAYNGKCLHVSLP